MTKKGFHLRHAKGLARVVAAVPCMVWMALGVPAVARAASSLRVICSVQAAWCDAMAESFSKATGMEVEMVRKSSGEALAALHADRTKPVFDVWWGGTGDPQLQAAEEGLTVSYKSPRATELAGWAQRFAWSTGYRSVGIYTGVLGFSYNPQLLAEKRVPPPVCWDDLVRPEYQGQIQVADPRRSGTAYTLLATLVQLKGEQAAMDYSRRLHRNVAQYASAGAAPAQAVADGKALIGITFMHDAMALADQGAPLVVVSPCEGTGYEIGAMSVVKGAPNLAAAKQFADFALAAKVQELAAQVKAFQLPSNRLALVPARALDMGQVKLINYDVALYGSSTERKRLLARWQQATGVSDL